MVRLWMHILTRVLSVDNHIGLVAIEIVNTIDEGR